MLFTGFAKIEVSRIDASEVFFDIPREHRPSAPDRSAALHPLWVQESGTERYRLINGREYYLAALEAGMMELPALLVERRLSDLELYRWCLEDLTAIRPLNPIEISAAFHKLKDHFRLNREEIVQSYFPLLGLGQQDKWYDVYYPLSRLEAPVQRALAEGTVTLETAAALTAAEGGDRMAYIQVVQKLRLSKSNQRESWVLLSDLSRLEKKSIRDILMEPAVAGILDHTSLTPSQKQERLKQELFGRRYPRYAAAAAQFDHLLHEARVPPAIQLRPTPYFADEAFHVQTQFRSIVEYRLIVETLRRLVEDGWIAKMVELI